MPKSVFVSGFFDLLHSGHIAFLEEAAKYGPLTVAIGSDRTYYEIKGRTPVNNEDERLYMVKSLSCISQAFISSGTGMLDFEAEFRQIRPNLLIVNEDGNLAIKKKLCDELEVDYLVMTRTPHANLTARSSTSMRDICTIPYRIDIAGGWLDQPFVSQYYPGPVITVSLEPTIEFNDRSGMASSTRRNAIDLWGPRMPAGNPEKLAKILFCYDNPPGKKYISGSQDSIGIVFPGLNIAQYSGDYWPVSIESNHDETLLQFLERSLYLIPLGPRIPSYDVLINTNIDTNGAQDLSEAAQNCWQAILNQDVRHFGQYFRKAFEAQIAMFPNMMNSLVSELIDSYRDQALGWKLSGAGGGGYLILVADHPIPDAIKVSLRRKSD